MGEYQLLSDMPNSSSSYTVYKSRWWALAMFCGINFCNAMLWVTFAPISDITAYYFGGSVGTEANVNLLATSYLILYLPGTIIGVIVCKKYSLRTTLLVGGLFTVVGATIRFLASLFRHRLSADGLYAWFMFGQCLAAMAQPFFLNVPATIASAWFSPDQRDIATTIGSLFNPLGNALGQVFPVIFVSQSSDDGPVKGMETLLGVETAMCLAALVVVWLFFKSNPPTPPSHSTKMKMNMEEGSKAIDGNSLGASVSRLKQDIHVLLHDKNYMVLFVAFSVGLGVFNALMTLINQLVQPHGYSNDDAGTFGALLIVTGLIGAGIVGYLLESTRAYRTILKLGFFGCFLASMLLVSLLYKNNFIGVLIAFGILGFFILPMLPAVLENCAEITYPIPEELSVGILFVGGNLIGIPFIFLLQESFKLDAFGPAPLNPPSIVIVGLVGIVCIILLFYDGQYKRLNCELSDPHSRKADKDALSSRILAEDRSDRPFLAGTQDESRDNSGMDARVVRVGSVDNTTASSARASVSWDTSINTGIGPHTEQKLGKPDRAGTLLNVVAANNEIQSLA